MTPLAAVLAAVLLVLPVLPATQGYVAYTAVLYLLVAFMGLSLLACGWVSYTFSKSGVVPNKW